MISNKVGLLHIGRTPDHMSVKSYVQYQFIYMNFIFVTTHCTHSV